MDKLGKQDNEIGPEPEPDDRKPAGKQYLTCFVCKKPILPGQLQYRLYTNKYTRRHATCERKSIGLGGPRPVGGDAGGGQQEISAWGGRVIRSSRGM